ncbi:hypothetical protein D2H50_16785 [Vibrio parahaemolyticus]|nr:hypothetical protein [Vibrio parahaemolyticus]
MIKLITKLLNIAGFLAAREAATQLKKAQATEKKRDKVIDKLDKAIAKRTNKSVAASVILTKLNQLGD